MMRRSKRFMDDKGAALIVVIVALLFIGIIAAVVLNLTKENFQTIGTDLESSKSFYHSEEAVDELKDSLKKLANEAARKAYEEYLKKYSINAMSIADDGELDETEEMKRQFNLLFAQQMQTDLSTFFKYKDPDTGAWVGGSTDYGDLLYNYKAKVTTGFDETDNPNFAYFETDDDGTVHIKNIKITYKDDTGNITTISTDLTFDVAPPSFTLGSNMGLSISAAEFALISDQTIRNTLSGAVIPLVMGNIYGGGVVKDLSGQIDHEKTAPSLLFSGTTNVKLFSDRIIAKTSIVTQNGVTLDVKASKSNVAQEYIHEYTNNEIWAGNLLMDGNSASVMNITGICNIADDLTLNTAGSKFTLGSGSQYYGYCTNKKLSDGTMSSDETSSSIIVNGQAVEVDLSAASKVSLAGKSYVEVPSVWGFTGSDLTTKTFPLGESISYRSLQAAYLLPGECIVGIGEGHNPLSMKDYFKLLDYTKLADTIDAYNTQHAGEEPITETDFRTRITGGTPTAADLTILSRIPIDKENKIKIGQSYLNERMDLDHYLDLDNPCSVEFVRYRGENLAYIYMNFRTPQLAAEYFRDYYLKYKSLVDGRMTHINKPGAVGKILVNTDTETEKDGVLTLNRSKVESTGNIIYYDGSELKFYYANVTDATSLRTVKDQQASKTKTFKNLYSTLEKSNSGNKELLTENIVNMSHVDEIGKTTKLHNGRLIFDATDEQPGDVVGARVQKILKDDGSTCTWTIPNGEFILGRDGRYYINNGDSRTAYMIISEGDVIINGSTVITTSEPGGRGLRYEWDANVDDGNDIDEDIDAGIVIARGNVTVANGAEFWGTIIAQGDIDLQGAFVYAKSTDVKNLIKNVNSIVFPYFSRESDGSSKIDKFTGYDFVNVVYDNWKKD